MPVAVSLRQRKRDDAHGQQQHNVKGASNQMRPDAGGNLFFHRAG
jgi:hypothetical protein